MDYNSCIEFDRCTRDGYSCVKPIEPEPVDDPNEPVDPRPIDPEEPVDPRPIDPEEPVKPEKPVGEYEEFENHCVDSKN